MLVSTELHGFSDASSYAYAAVVYLRVELESSVKSVLVALKTRVVLLSGQTIPRLELLGAVILARLVKHVVGALSGTLRINRVSESEEKTSLNECIGLECFSSKNSSESLHMS